MSKKPEGLEKRIGKANPESAEPGPQEKDYEVGYGKPPKHTRFAKGKSGNPRGRPRKKKPRPIKLSDAPSDSYVEAEAYRLIELLENGEKIELPTLRAIVRAMAVSALKGNRLSQKYFLEYVERQEERHLQYKVQNYVRLENLKRDGERAIAECERRGLPPPELLPHPEDIVHNPSTGEAWVAGPETVEDLRFWEHIVQERDFLLLCSVQSGPRRDRAAASQPDTYCLYTLLAQVIDHYLPRRLRWQDKADVKLMWEYECLPRRERKRRFAAERRRLDATKPRLSLITPEIDEGLGRISQQLRQHSAERRARRGEG